MNDTRPPVIRVQAAPKRNPRYVSVVLDGRGQKGGKIQTLHSFGQDSLLARVRADRFRAECLLAYQYLRQAVTDEDQEALVDIFAATIGVSTLEKLSPLLDLKVELLHTTAAKAVAVQLEGRPVARRALN